MSLGGLAIAIGMMVDGTIVMVENVDRMLSESKADESRMHVVARACHEVGRPILFAIAIIIIVFLPLFTLRGVEGKTFRPLAYTVALAMFGSLLYAILIAPMLSHFLMRRSGKIDITATGESKEPIYRPTAADSIPAGRTVLRWTTMGGRSVGGGAPIGRCRDLSPARLGVHTKAKRGHDCRSPHDGPVNLA